MTLCYQASVQFAYDAGVLQVTLKPHESAVITW